MKFVFFGTPRIAAIVLEDMLKEGLVPAALVCNPDRPAGRKRIITAPMTKMIAADWDKEIEILQPEKMDDEFAEKLKRLNCDFFVVVAYGRIIPKKILEIPRFGAIGIHPSLLPKYRGASPIQSVILAGEGKTGVSLYLVDEKMDHGRIIAQEETVVENDCYCKLEEKLAHLGAKVFSQTILNFIKGKIESAEQDESLATFTKKFITADGFVNLDKDSPEEITRKVRALNPEPGAWTVKDGKRMKILDAEVSDDGKLILKKIQMEGGKPVEMKC